MPVVQRLHAVHLIALQRAIDARHWFLVLRRCHLVRELVEIWLLVDGEVGSVDGARADRLRDGAALAQPLLPPGGLIAADDARRCSHARVERVAFHDWKAPVKAVVLVVSVRHLRLPLGPPALSKQNEQPFFILCLNLFAFERSCRLCAMSYIIAGRHPGNL